MAPDVNDQKILEFLKKTGPMTPAVLGKEFGISQIFASAMLGSLSSQGAVKISNLKIGGGSPLYYLSEHSEMLQNFSNRLNPKDKQAYELLKEKKVLKDSLLVPLVRVSLRAIKDFAIPLIVTMNGEKQLFWKWYMFSDGDAEKEIKNILGIDKKEEKKEVPVQKEVQKTIQQTPIQQKPTEKVEEKQVKKELKPKEEPRPKVEVKETIKEIAKEKSQVKEIKENKDKEPIFAPIANVNEFNDEFSVVCKSSFGKKVLDYFKLKGIKIIRYEQRKKNKEYNMIIQVPSAIGSSKCFCKVIDKKKITDGEMALAMIEAQQIAMQATYITSGTLNKAAEEKMKSMFKDINYIRV